jgi:hypothetical protein
LRHSSFLIVSALSYALSYNIVRRAPKKTRSSSSLIARIDKISIAIYKSLSLSQTGPDITTGQISPGQIKSDFLIRTNCGMTLFYLAILLDVN